MEEMEDTQLKLELDEISQRIDRTLKQIETVFEQSSEVSIEYTDGSA